MSVIFKTLRKLRGQSLEGEKRAEKLKKGRNIYSFRRIFFSPLGALLIILFIFFSGMATLYGVSYLKDYLEQKSRESFLIKNEKAQTIKTETGKERDELTKKKAVFEEAPVDVPPPPKTIPIEQARPGKLYLPSTSKKDFSTKETRIVRYIPPRFPNNTKAQEKKITSAGAARESPVYQRETPKSLTYTPATLLPKSSEISQTSPPDILKIKAGPERDIKKLPAMTPDIAKSYRAKPPAIQPPPKTVPKLALKEKSTNAGKRILSESPEQLKGRKKEEDVRIGLENVEKTARIASLVAKIQKSMGTGSSDQIEDLIDELALLKGEDNSYVLKLKAFWRLKQNDYESAALFLNEVLRKNENDLEAGINMAILEIKTSQIPEAKKRLARLREIYPENALIPELIQKLK
ncbi:MAG: tetratricopeptide repeat protein [Deltaproteobacteria bacterium]|nr:tetratricopeptide repeat protein [Deltaproteobacteria bacterium]